MTGRTPWPSKKHLPRTLLSQVLPSDDPVVVAALVTDQSFAAPEALLRARALCELMIQRKLLDPQPLSSGDLSARSHLLQILSRFQTSLQLSWEPLLQGPGPAWRLRFHLGESSSAPRMPTPVFIALRSHLRRLGYRGLQYQFVQGVDTCVNPFPEAWLANYIVPTCT